MSDMAGDNENLSRVLSLSDEELFEKLQEHGYSAGPIVDSTRAVYQKKLIKILEDGYVAPPDYSCSSEGEKSDSEEQLRQRVLHVDSFQPSPVTSGSSKASFRQNLTHESKPINPNLQTGSQPSVLSKAKLVIVLVVAAILIALLYQNMEGNRDSNPVPKVH